MKIKDLKIKIAMALTLVMMGAPVVKAFAAETNTNDVLSNVTGEQYTDYLRDVFTKSLGTDGTFKTTYEDSKVKEEANGKTGEVRTTDKSTNKVIDTYNYLDILKQREEDYAPITTEYTATQEEYSTLDGQAYLGVDDEVLSSSDLKKEVDEIKKEIKEKYGKENKLQVVSDDGHVVQELNGVTGEYRLTYKDDNTSCSYNYFNELDQAVKDAQSNTNK